MQKYSINRNLPAYSKKQPELISVKNIASGLKVWAKSIASVMIKRECVCCSGPLQSFETDICTKCLLDLPSSFTWAEEDSPADKVFWGRVRIEKVTSLFLYQGRYRNLLYSIKYKGNIRLALRMGKMLGRAIASQDIDLIVPVPLHPRKKRKRGYNQSEIVCRGIEASLKQTAPSVATENRLLERKRFTRTQTQKDRIDRWKNVQNAFNVNLKKAGQIRQRFKDKGKTPSLLLVDDVLTTGATLDACASLLKETLDCRISIATLAYVP